MKIYLEILLRILSASLLFLVAPNNLCAYDEVSDPIVVGANIGNVPWEFQNDNGKNK